jgi:hypothetical protein
MIPGRCPDPQCSVGSARFVAGLSKKGPATSGVTLSPTRRHGNVVKVGAGSSSRSAVNEDRLQGQARGEGGAGFPG